MHLLQVGGLSLGWGWELEGGHGVLEEEGAAAQPFLQIGDEPPFRCGAREISHCCPFLFLSLEEEPPMWFIPNLLKVETDQTSTVFPFKNII